MKYPLSIFLVLVLMTSPVKAQFEGNNISRASRSLAADKLAGAVRFQTVSAVDSANFKYDEFLSLHEYLAASFPLVHKVLKLQVINEYSLLYTWPGYDAELKPILFSAHLDVVPVEVASATSWQEQPYGGVVKDGYVWGRGTMDDKYRVIAILEAVERLLEQGYTPKRTLLLAFGHDEEVGGYEGAGVLSKEVERQWGKLEAVFDEGLAIVENVIPGLETPVALVGTAAKGNLNLLLTVNGTGGHSSAPPDETPIDILSHAIQQLHKNPFEPRLIPVTREMLGLLADEMGGQYRFALRHYGLFKGKILKKLAEDRATDVLIRTKMVPTIITAGEKHNVLPREATAVINIRILNGENEQTVLQHVRNAINDDRVKIERYGVYTPPSPVTATDTWLYGALQASIRNVFPGVMVVPALFPGATDSKHYDKLTSNIFRFVPQVVDRESAQLVHNANERISVQVFENSITFYASLIQNTCSSFESLHMADRE